MPWAGLFIDMAALRLLPGTFIKSNIWRPSSRDGAE